MPVVCDNLKYPPPHTQGIVVFVFSFIFQTGFLCRTALAGLDQVDLKLTETMHH